MIKYDSSKALSLAEKIMKFITDEARKASTKLGEVRGNFPNFEKSSLRKHFKFMRNATVTTIAPTGTISIIAGATSGIEPLFAVSFVRNVLAGAHLLEINPEFEQLAKENGFYNKKLMMKIAKTGTLKDCKEVPRKIQELFRTALEILPEWHIKMQAAFQKYTDNAVSKTINLPEKASPKDIEKAYLLAHKLKCKGITVYRYNSKKQQVLTFGNNEPVIAAEEFAGGACIECKL